MRLVRAEVGAFGSLRDVKLDLDAPLTVVLGENEAGKSTIFHFLQTMFYGFYPANRDVHPYVPWGASAGEGSLRVRLDSGAEVTVTRRLLSAPSGQLIEDGSVRDLRNQTAPFVGHIDQKVFEAVYRLTLQQMAAMEPGAWEEVQDRLLGGMNVDHVRSARDVLAKLDDEAKALWRDDRRGRPRVRELNEEAKRLRDRRAQAAERDAKLREALRGIEDKEKKLADVKDEHVRFEAHRRRITRLRPVLQRLEQIRLRQEEAGDVTELGGLPERPQDWLREKADLLSARRLELEGLAAREAALQTVIEACSEADKLLLAHAASLDDLLAQRSAFHNRSNRLQELEVEVQSAEDRLAAEADRILLRWNDEVADAVASLAVADLNQRMQELQKSERTFSEVSARAKAARELRSAPPLRPRLIVAAFGAALAAVGLALGIMLLAGVGLVAFAAGATLAYVAWEARGRVAGSGIDRELADAETLRAAARRKLAVVLEGIPLPEGRLDEPDLQLGTDLNSLRQLLIAARDLRKRRIELEEIARRDLEMARERAGAAGLEAQGAFLEVLQRVSTCLEAARLRDTEARDAQKEQDRVRRDVERVTAELRSLSTEVEDARVRLEKLGDGDAEVGVLLVERRRTAELSSASLREALEQETPDWETLVREAEGAEEEPATEEEILRVEERCETLENEKRELDGDLKALRKEVELSESHEAVDQIDSELQWLQEQIDEAERTRDRLQLLANVIRRADQRFRERHQPDVLRRAGLYLSTFTSGRYDRIMAEEGEDALYVVPPGGNGAMRVGPPLSQGTRDQIYLALRLAIADHLDEGRERVPLLLDETFVNWDERRRRAGFEILTRMSADRQLILFTCHPWFAREAEAHSARIISPTTAPVPASPNS